MMARFETTACKTEIAGQAGDQRFGGFEDVGLFARMQREGWELVAAFPDPKDPLDHHTYWKRPLADPPKGQQGTVYDDRGPVMYRATPGRHSGPWPPIERQRSTACPFEAHGGPFVGDPGYRSGGDAAAKVHDAAKAPGGIRMPGCPYEDG